METLAAILRGVSAGLLCLVVPVTLWQVVIGLRGLFPMRKRPVREEKKHRFAVIVCARNEEAVIGGLLDSLAAQDYPREAFTVFVVADNCTDDTAGAARRGGAVVYEREDSAHRGKGFALNWLFDRLHEDYPDDFDAFAVFDADNLAAPDFLTRINDALCTGADVAQGYRDTKNVEDSAVSATYAIYWHMLARFYHRARYNWGLPCMICGTGFAAKWDCVADGWHTRSLVEDNEFSLQQANKGRVIVPVNDAVFYDEQPTTWRVSFRQRFRWLVGGMQCMRYEMRQCLRGIGHGRLASLDGILYMLSLVALGATAVAGMLWLAGLGVQATFASAAHLRSECLWLLATAGVGLAVMWLLALATVLLEHKSLRRYWKGVLLYPVFLVPLSFLSLAALCHPWTEWKPIVHDRAYSLADMSAKQEKNTAEPLDSTGGHVV